MYRQDLEFRLNSNDIANAFMLYGAEDYQIEFYAKEILSRFDGAELVSMCFDEYDYSKAKEHLEQNSLFGDINVLHIKTDKKIPLKELKTLVKLSSSSSIFVYELHDDEQRSIAEHAKVFGENFARFFAPKDENEASNLLLKHAKKIGLAVPNPHLLARIWHIQNKNIYLSASELNRICTLEQGLNDEIINKLVSSLSPISFEDIFDGILSAQLVPKDLQNYFENSMENEIAFINDLYREFYKFFRLNTAWKYNPSAKIAEILGYNPPVHVQNKLRSQARIFNTQMFLEIFMHLNTCDYELKKPKNFIDKELFLLSGILKLQNIIAKHSKN